MKIANVLLVHKNPHQVCRLITRLNYPDIDCWIHIDKKHDTVDFRNLILKKKVYLVQPNLKVDWGCYNTVEAMLTSIDNVLNAKENYAYINFMSGQDYPLRPLVFFYNYLKEYNGYEFIGNRPFEESHQNIIRFKKYHFNNYTFPCKGLFERVINKILPERKFPYPFEVRKGPQWMTLTRDAMHYILEFTYKNPRYVNYFKTVHIPDEFFFQTLLFNSPFQKRMKNQIFHYIDWSETKNNPKTLGINDYDKLINSNLFFARKFDETFDSSILEAIDKNMGGINC